MLAAEMIDSSGSSTLVLCFEAESTVSLLRWLISLPYHVNFRNFVATSKSCSTQTSFLSVHGYHRLCPRFLAWDIPVDNISSALDTIMLTRTMEREVTSLKMAELQPQQTLFWVAWCLSWFCWFCLLWDIYIAYFQWSQNLSNYELDEVPTGSHAATISVTILSL